MAQLMPLPLTVSCFSEIQIGFNLLVLAHPGSPGIRAVKRVCVWSIDVQVEQATSAVHKSHQLHVYTTNGEFTGCSAIFSNSILRRNSTTNFTRSITEASRWRQCPRTHTAQDTDRLWNSSGRIHDYVKIRTPCDVQNDDSHTGRGRVERRRRDLRLRRCNNEAVEQNFNTYRSGKNAKVTFWIKVLVWSLNCILCCREIFEFDDIPTEHSE